ncbi:41801_t:CDS:1, partial [Gigaspora margarita]
HRIANSTIGIVTDINLTTKLIYINFCVEGVIINVSFSKYTDNFFLNGIPASCKQYPIQNAFVLTVQGLTVPNVLLNLNSQVFEIGQANVALSHCTKWNHINIHFLDRSAFMVDPSIVNEYAQLENFACNPLILSF